MQLNTDAMANSKAMKIEKSIQFLDYLSLFVFFVVRCFLLLLVQFLVCSKYPIGNYDGIYWTQRTSSVIGIGHHQHPIVVIYKMMLETRSGERPARSPSPISGSPPEREWKDRRMYTYFIYLARTGSLRIARWRSLGLKSGPPASGLHDPDLSPFFMKHHGDQRGRHHPKTPSALKREKGGGMTTHARPNLERR